MSAELIIGNPVCEDNTKDVGDRLPPELDRLETASMSTELIKELRMIGYNQG